MREIKFRAWDKVEKKFINSPIIAINGNVYRNGRDYEDGTVTFNIKIQQFTGLKDKNGKEIYEGDIVKEVEIEDGGETSIGKIIFSGFAYGFKISTGIDTWDIWEDEDLHTYEVIGNIYENPDLIKKNI